MKTNISRIIFFSAILSLFLPTQLLAQDFHTERQAILDQINGYRTSIGLSALTMWQDGGCADRGAKEDMESGRAHASQGTCGDRAQNSNPNWPSLAEVVAKGMQQMWNEGPPPAGDPCRYPSQCYMTHGHYINMTGNFTEVAVGIYQAPSGRVWVNTNFR